MHSVAFCKYTQHVRFRKRERKNTHRKFRFQWVGCPILDRILIDLHFLYIEDWPMRIALYDCTSQTIDRYDLHRSPSDDKPPINRRGSNWKRSTRKDTVILDVLQHLWHRWEQKKNNRTLTFSNWCRQTSNDVYIEFEVVLHSEHLHQRDEHQANVDCPKWKMQREHHLVKWIKSDLLLCPAMWHAFNDTLAWLTTS